MMTREMRPSRVLAKLRAGDVVSCFKINLCDARAVEIAAMAGFDCAWLCQEHVPNDLASVEQGVWAAKAHDMDIMVRVARGSYSNLVRPLEMDAAGIMVPHVMNAVDAQQIVRTTRFQPLGMRPCDGGNADGAYCAVPFPGYVKQANEQRFVALQIEDPEPLEELDEIAALPGVDMLFFGPGDFSHSIGVPGQMDDPRIAEARVAVLEAALKHGKVAGCPASPANIAELVDLGFRFLTMGADVVALWQHCEDCLEAFKPFVGDA